MPQRSTAVGSADSRLIVIRGNSGSGKSTIARAVRDRYAGHVGYGCALVEQDHLRRILLRERDEPGGLAPLLIDQTVRLALDHGYHVIVEGILHAARYADMLTALCNDHRGHTAVYYLDIPLAETLRRHTQRPQATEFSPADMAGWYAPHDLLGTPDEHVIDDTSSLDHSIERVWNHLADAPARHHQPPRQPGT